VGTITVLAMLIIRDVNGADFFSTFTKWMAVSLKFDMPVFTKAKDIAVSSEDKTGEQEKAQRPGYYSLNPEIHKRSICC
jgi:hypothetical protein